MTANRIVWKKRYVWIFLILWIRVLAVSGQNSSTPPSPIPRFEEEIKAFEAADRVKFPAPGGILFVGSSSIRFWKTLAADFPGLPVLNRGFGGAFIGEVLHYSDRIILPYQPLRIVLFVGGNDLADGKSPQEVLATFKKLCVKIHAKLPRTRLYYVSINPTIARWQLDEQNRRTNELIRKFVAKSSWMQYIDSYSRMLDEKGQPRPELWGPDRLHLNETGYRFWAEIIRPYLR